MAGSSSTMRTRSAVGSSGRFIRVLSSRLTFAQSCDHRGEQRVLGGVNFFRERFQCLTGRHADGCLIENRTAIHVGGDSMHGASGEFHSATKRLSDSIEPGKTRQQTRMKIDNFPGESVQKS